ncbi:MAG: S9 family peptidase [Verrucomicrobia bacterium]|nr:MAG: S9 family peptidase [Verrucomicrobiota bacterium]
MKPSGAGHYDPPSSPHKDNSRSRGGRGAGLPFPGRRPAAAQGGRTSMNRPQSAVRRMRSAGLRVDRSAPFSISTSPRQSRRLNRAAMSRRSHFRRLAGVRPSCSQRTPGSIAGGRSSTRVHCRSRSPKLMRMGANRCASTSPSGPAAVRALRAGCRQACSNRHRYSSPARSSARSARPADVRVSVPSTLTARPPSITPSRIASNSWAELMGSANGSVPGQAVSGPWTSSCFSHRRACRNQRAFWTSSRSRSVRNRSGLSGDPASSRLCSFRAARGSGSMGAGWLEMSKITAAIRFAREDDASEGGCRQPRGAWVPAGDRRWSSRGIAALSPAAEIRRLPRMTTSRLHPDGTARGRPPALVLAVMLPLLAAGAPAAGPVPGDTWALEAGLTPLDVARLQYVGSAAVSPDGLRAAFVRYVPRDLRREKDGPSRAELWVVDLATGRSRPFVAGPVYVRSPAWTPDGCHIGFLAKREGDEHAALYLIPSDGGEARKALELETDIAAYSFASDGRRVAVTAVEPEPASRRKDRDRGFTEEVYEEDWRSRRVWVAELFGENANLRPLGFAGHVHQVHWRPHADELAVTVTPTPAVDDSYVRQRVWIVDATTGAVRCRVANPGKLGAVAWNPTGDRLAMIAAEDEHDPSAGRLMEVDPATGAFRDLLPGYLGEVEDFAWTASDTLVAVTSEGVRTVVLRLRLAEGAVRTERLAGPRGPAFTRIGAGGGRICLVGSTAWHPAELFRLDGPGRWERLTDSNPWLAERRMARQEVVTFHARDGLELEGVLIRRLDDDGRPGPLILSVHGGPESHIRNGWLTSYSLPGQVAAARGMAVFYPNYRGSTGRGVAFSKLGQADPAGKEFDDLVDAVDHLVDLGVADPDRVGVTGGSYGGYATAWCSTRYSERFAAGVMFVGISDKVSKVGTTDIPDEEYLVHALFRPWEKWMFLLERSPIYHAGNCRTPLLILHGKADPRVHPGQSMEMYRHLKLRSRAPVRLVFYPGEGHGNRRAASRYDYHLRMLRWFEHYLRGPGGPAPDWRIEHPLE